MSAFLCVREAPSHSARRLAGSGSVFFLSSDLKIITRFARPSDGSIKCAGADAFTKRQKQQELPPLHPGNAALASTHLRLMSNLESSTGAGHRSLEPQARPSAVLGRLLRVVYTRTLPSTTSRTAEPNSDAKIGRIHLLPQALGKPYGPSRSRMLR